jgi:hypothetical protein
MATDDECHALMHLAPPALGLFDHYSAEATDNWACDIGSPDSPSPEKAQPQAAVVLYTRPSSRRPGLGDKAALGDRSGTSKDKATVTLTEDVLRPYYDKPLYATAHALGVCATAIKRACRRLGIASWPYRHIRAIHSELNRVEPLAATSPEALARVHALHAKLRALFPEKSA